MKNGAMILDQALDRQLVSFHDASIDKIELLGSDILFHLSGIESHHYDDEFFRAETPPIGSLVLRFVLVSEMRGMPLAYVGRNLDDLKDSLYVDRVAKQPSSWYSVDISGANQGGTSFWKVEFKAQGVQVESR